MVTQMVKISPKAKRVYLQRYLLSKFVHFKKELELRDICCLFENQLWLEKKCQLDPNFLQKFGKDLESLSIIMKEFNFKTGTTDRAIDRFSSRINQTIPNLVLPKRNYSEAKRRCNGLFQLADAPPMGVPRRNVPPTARIGKGYRDKGSARDLAKDGSPSWQEVATHRGPIYHKGKRIQNVQANRSAATIAESIVRSVREYEKEQNTQSSPSSPKKAKRSKAEVLIQKIQDLI